MPNHIQQRMPAGHRRKPVLSLRQAGVCLHLTSLPGDYGIGELGAAAKAFVDSIVGMGLGVWQFLPAGPTAYGDSPYQPLSTFAGNEMLIDIADLVALGLLTPQETRPLTALPREHVDYARLIPLKRALLETAAMRFGQQATPAMRGALDRFVAANNDSWLHDYALFRVLKTRHHERPWPDWDARLRQRNAAALAAETRRSAAAIDAIKTQQFLFQQQWQALQQYATGRGVSLFGDMPIYIALDSADAWANPELLRIDKDGRPDSVAGVPPDYFSQDGQLWGNPLYDWPRHEQQDYRWWRARIARALGQSDLLRIDHFRGFESYWAVPADEETARNGRWEAGPGHKLFDSLYRHLGQLPVVAEDLGVITAQVDALRRACGMPGMKVLQFEIPADHFNLDDIAEDCVCYTGTHDNDTTVGWFRGGAGDTRSADEIARTRGRVLQLGNGDAETAHDDVLRLAFQSAAKLAIAPMQDYLGLGTEARLNTPGKADGNWRWRMTGAPSAERCRQLRNMVIASQRGPAT